MATISSSSLIALSLITASIMSIVYGFRKIVNLYYDYHKRIEKQKKQEKIDQAESELHDACNTGDLSDIMNAANKIGKVKK